MSSGLILDALKTKADALAEEISAQDTGLTVMYAIHHHGQLQNTLHVMEDLILQHPAGNIARSILKRKHSPLEPSQFHGLAVSQSHGWFGLGRSVSMLALISLNVDQYDSFDSAMYDIYHHTYHSLEIAQLCRRPEMMDRLQNRPMVPKRGPMAEAKANLRADIFTALMLTAEGYDDVIERLAKHRARQVLERMPQTRPAYFPFILTAEATDFAYRDIYKNFDESLTRIDRCQRIVTEISDVTTDDQIRQWWQFCEPAQDMAWRGYDPAVILGAALHTCEDPYIRAIAHQMIGTIGINPSHLENLRKEYNPFLNLAVNFKGHLNLVDDAFQVALSQGLADNSAKPFLVAANQQNRDLIQGRFFGWCAAALQSAGRAFERAKLIGKPAEQAAQLEFQIHRDGPMLENLQALCKEIVRKQRDGETVTLDQLPALAKLTGNLDMVIESVETTLDDPNYHLSLDAMQKMTRTLEPAGPAVPQQIAHLAPATAVIPQPQVLEFSPGTLSLPPLTTRTDPVQHRPQVRTSAPPTATTNKISATLPTGDLSLELAFAEADEAEKT